jgi:DNA-binding response OmpR family regulator
MKLLVVEDEIDLLRSIQAYLESENFICDTAKDYMEGSDKIATYQYDCVIIDITLPNGSGLDLVKELKQEYPETGIIIISAKNSLDDKIKGLDHGSDDYLTKPFHLSELNARVKALIRRRNFSGADIIQCSENISIDLQTNKVMVKNQEIILTQKEYQLLVYLVSGKNKVYTKEAIAEHLWGSNMDQSDSFAFIYTHIKNLRRKIVDAGSPDPIKTVYGIGYKFDPS